MRRLIGVFGTIPHAVAPCSTMTSFAAELTAKSLDNADTRLETLRTGWHKLTNRATDKGFFGITLAYDEVTCQFHDGHEMEAIEWLRAQGARVTLFTECGRVATAGDRVTSLDVEWPQSQCDEN